ncbi:glycine--tRNA ligase subunit beta [Paraferrimonas haliotis]|uniref:Glycine--tRNA ligase beta subunit n=1 Tax=Paraferrimonas haliotis TaxID=2013866 RepID=A0AA37TSN8_9GAMM|nr:glycine--tRNA ligase subunit beta [Paraferrimonas haliotis]GLS84810.1 glycine--tRNA ligase beta subunit [Paraferrimonas haliotis]
MQNFLLELGTEELPPKSLRQLAQSLSDNIETQLDAAELSFETITWHAAPRRLAVTVTQLANTQPDKVVEKKGPSVKAAFDSDGNPTKAAQGWARSNGITVEEAERVATDKGEWLLFKAEVQGKTVAQLLPEIVNTAVSKLPIPKPMRWGSSRTQFIRPVHTLTMLYGDQLIPAKVLDIESGRVIRGHRFMGDQELTLTHADDYLTSLEKQGKVIADYESRKAFILNGVTQAANAVGGKADLDDALVEEVTSLVEWPVILIASFDPEFLTVPSEALVYTMKGDQKYFPVYDEAGELLPKFIFVSNIESKDPNQVIDGNEKVVRPRLADAEFFFKTDRKHSLQSRLESLSGVTFQKQLGSLKARSERISAIAGQVAELLGANVADAQRAGLLSKTDLMTEMVMEFTDTQGVMGMHYARLDGESEAVAVAISEQYLPKFSGDRVPSHPVSIAVALAEKLDTLTGIFGINQPPKGDKDPFALRRAAIGTLRIIVDNQLKLDLQPLIKYSVAQHQSNLSNENTANEVIDFLLGRFRSWYQEQGISVDVIQAVLARRPTSPTDFDHRVKAVNHFRGLEQAEALAAANKRVGNILAKNSSELGAELTASLLQEPAEIALAEQLQQVSKGLDVLAAKGEYQQVLTSLAELRANIDAFFDNVMVMADDPALKQNRLALLNQLRNQFLLVADISVLQ